jgi:hypothetical protein
MAEIGQLHIMNDMLGHARSKYDSAGAAGFINSPYHTTGSLSFMDGLYCRRL